MKFRLFRPRFWDPFSPTSCSFLACASCLVGFAFVNRYARSFRIALKTKNVQIYNSTVTQMSACLLSLSVMSLLLPVSYSTKISSTAHPCSAPGNKRKILMLFETDCCWHLQTAFHASFTDSATADKAVLQISRGTSIVSFQIASDAARPLTVKDSASGVCAVPAFSNEIARVHVSKYTTACNRRRILSRCFSRDIGVI